MPAEEHDTRENELRVAAEVGARWTVLRVAGEVDIRTAPRLSEQVAAHFAGEATPVPALVFDLSEVTFFASVGLAVLAEAHRTATARASTVWVVAADRAVTRPLEITGLDKVLTVVDSVEAATAAIGGS